MATLSENIKFNSSGILSSGLNVVLQSVVSSGVNPVALAQVGVEFLGSLASVITSSIYDLKISEIRYQTTKQNNNNALKRNNTGVLDFSFLGQAYNGKVVLDSVALDHLLLANFHSNVNHLVAENLYEYACRDRIDNVVLDKIGHATLRKGCNRLIASYYPFVVFTTYKHRNLGQTNKKTKPFRFFYTSNFNSFPFLTHKEIYKKDHYQVEIVPGSGMYKVIEPFNSSLLTTGHLNCLYSYVHYKTMKIDLHVPYENIFHYVKLLNLYYDLKYSDYSEFDRKMNHVSYEFLNGVSDNGYYQLMNLKDPWNNNYSVQTDYYSVQYYLLQRIIDLGLIDSLLSFDSVSYLAQQEQADRKFQDAILFGKYDSKMVLSVAIMQTLSNYIGSNFSFTLDQLAKLDYKKVNELVVLVMFFDAGIVLNYTCLPLYSLYFKTIIYLAQKGQLFSKLALKDFHLYLDQEFIDFVSYDVDTGKNISLNRSIEDIYSEQTSKLELHLEPAPFSMTNGLGEPSNNENENISQNDGENVIQDDQEDKFKSSDVKKVSYKKYVISLIIGVFLLWLV